MASQDAGDGAVSPEREPRRKRTASGADGATKKARRKSTAKSPKPKPRTIGSPGSRKPRRKSGVGADADAAVAGGRRRVSSAVSPKRRVSSAASPSKKTRRVSKKLPAQGVRPAARKLKRGGSDRMLRPKRKLVVRRRVSTITPGGKRKTTKPIKLRRKRSSTNLAAKGKGKGKKTKGTKTKKNVMDLAWVIKKNKQKLESKVSSDAFQQELSSHQGAVTLNEDSDDDGDAVEPIAEHPEETETKDPLPSAQAAPDAARTEEKTVDTPTPGGPDSSSDSSDEDDDDEELDETSLAVLKIATELAEAQAQLPKLNELVEKQSPSLLKRYQKRYVCVYDYNVYYSKAQITQERLDSGDGPPVHSLPMVVVNSIDPMVSQSNREFVIQARDPKSGSLRDYRFRVATKEDRDRWVQGLQAHYEHLQSTLRLLALSKSSQLNIEIQWAGSQ